jgi:hypothetical protein
MNGMYWWYVCAGVAVISAAVIVAAFKNGGWNSDMIVAVTFIVSTLLLTVCIGLSITSMIKCPQKESAFLKQKQYIESHVSNNALEDTEMTKTKTELNEWLFEAQYHKKCFGGFSFYSNDVLEFEPIQ